MNIFSSIFKRKTEPKKVSIRGPLECVEGKMMLQIPLEAGGQDLAPFVKKIGHISNGYLRVEILPWMAQKLDVHVGSMVEVDNLEGEFRITRIGEEQPGSLSEPSA